MSNVAREAGPPLVFVDPPEDGRAFGGSRLLFRSAAREFDVDVTDQEDYDWLVELGAGMLIDHLVDVEKQDVSPLFRDIIAGNLRTDLAADLQIRAINYMGRKPLEARQQIYQWVQEVNDLAIAQRNATKPAEVIDINIRESEILSSLLSLEHQGMDDEDERLAFNGWLRGWGRTGYLLDTLVDAKADYANGESGVKPTPFVMAHYASVLSAEAAVSLRKTPSRLLGKSALVGLNYVVRGMRREVHAKT